MSMFSGMFVVTVMIMFKGTVMVMFMVVVTGSHS